MESSRIIDQLRRVGADLTMVEVKSASGGLPKTVQETVSAFANGSGGTLLLGLSEEDGFTRPASFDHIKIRDALAGVCANDLTPAIRAPIEIEDFEGGHIIRMDVPELDPVDKPCWIKNRGGEYRGSFIRGGDGDRLLNHYEVSQLLANRSQPTWDEEIVDRATPEDFDDELVQSVLARVRDRARRAFAEQTDTQALVRLGALQATADGYRPTLAGLMCLGQYPQQFFPQLFVSFVSLPGLTMGEELADGTRFLDNQTCDGPIPFMVESAVEAVRRNMRVAAIITGAGRRDRYDYPLEAVRELIVNAVMHRDYSPEARGTQVQVEMYPNRLVVKSPGGLYGSVDVSELGVQDVSSSRNAKLAKLLTDVAMPRSGEVVCENRGSGMSRIVSRLKDAGMTPPRFDATPSHFHVTVPQQALLDVATVQWIGTLGANHLSDAQQWALAMMRSNGTVSNEMLRVWGVPAAEATTALTDLVARGIATKTGGRRYARYQLAEPPSDLVLFDAESAGSTRPPTPDLDPRVAAVVEAIRSGATTSREIQQKLNLSYTTLMRRIRSARDSGIIEETHARHSRAQSYRITDPTQRTDSA